jgi:pyrimidine operon attenuation protein / uracil phosphoribosyltransferase
LKTLLTASKLNIVVQRLAHQLVENNPNPQNLALIALQPRGVFFANRIYKCLSDTLKIQDINYGKLDITLYRDDIGAEEIRMPKETEIHFSVEGKDVVLIDDVLYTGRTIRSAMDALLVFGRPKSIQLMVLIDRRFSRELPIQADFVGQSVDTILSQKVKVHWLETDKKDEVILIDQ